MANKENADEEWQIYQFLYENLTGEQKKSFLRYADLQGDRQREERKAAYEHGFKTAIKLIVESLKDE